MTYANAAESYRRNAILTACRRKICIVNNGRSMGFTCNENEKPIVLKRFGTPATMAEIASLSPEFKEEIDQ